MYKLESVAQAEKFVQRQQAAGNDVRWDNYNLVFFQPHPAAWAKTNGAFRDGRWGFQYVSEVQPDGTWSVDYRNIKRSRV